MRGATIINVCVIASRNISTHAPRAGSDKYKDGRRALETHFNPRSPCGERPVAVVIRIVAKFISTHAPRAGSDTRRPAGASILFYFNPRSPCGERLNALLDSLHNTVFQPTLPVRGATVLPTVLDQAEYISTHAPRAGSDRAFAKVCYMCIISTHAPRAGSDPGCAKRISYRNYFNPRSPCGERLDLVLRHAVVGQFQPTLPVRGATHTANAPVEVKQFQPTLPVRGATRVAENGVIFNGFQPTLPVRGATRPPFQQSQRAFISTHAPRAGSDHYSSCSFSYTYFYFNPRSPCGERR